MRAARGRRGRPRGSGAEPPPRLLEQLGLDDRAADGLHAGQRLQAAHAGERLRAGQYGVSYRFAVVREDCRLGE